MTSTLLRSALIALTATLSLHCGGDTESTGSTESEAQISEDALATASDVDASSNTSDAATEAQQEREDDAVMSLADSAESEEVSAPEPPQDTLEEDDVAPGPEDSVSDTSD